MGPFGAEQLDSLEKQVDTVVGQTVTTAVAYAPSSLQDSLKSHVKVCFQKYQQDLQGLPGWLDQQIMQTVMPKLDDIRHECSERCDALHTAADSKS